MCLWMETLGLNENAHKLGLIGATLISSTLFSVFAVRHRATVAAMLLGTTPESQPTWWRIFARIWHGLAILYAAAIVVTALAAWVIFGVWGVNLAETGSIAHTIWRSC